MKAKKSHRYVPDYSWLGNPERITRFTEALDCDIASRRAGHCPVCGAQAAAEPC
jgi:hypothetical protein